jgi:hypothetical protein
VARFLLFAAASLLAAEDRAASRMAKVFRFLQRIDHRPHIHPLDPEDAAITAAMRAMVSSSKGARILASLPQHFKTIQISSKSHRSPPAIRVSGLLG